MIYLTNQKTKFYTRECILTHISFCWNFIYVGSDTSSLEVGWYTEEDLSDGPKSRVRRALSKPLDMSQKFEKYEIMLAYVRETLPTEISDKYFTKFYQLESSLWMMYPDKLKKYLSLSDFKGMKNIRTGDLPTNYMNRYNFLKQFFKSNIGLEASDVEPIVKPVEQPVIPLPLKKNTPIYGSDIDYNGKYLDLYINDHHIYRTETFNLKRGETLSITTYKKITDHEFEKVLKILDQDRKDITDYLSFNIHVKEI